MVPRLLALGHSDCAGCGSEPRGREGPLFQIGFFVRLVVALETEALEGLMRVLKILAGVLAAVILLVAALFVGARFHDGPLSMIPGGPLSSGEIVAGPIDDWSFAEEVELIEFQLDADETSRTSWILVTDGRAFIPCSLGFPPGKSWHLRADRDGDAVVRIMGKRYAVTMTRISTPTLDPKLEAIVTSKYGGFPSDDGAWFFELKKRTS